ncbi:MAG: pentapeptide repeat-containing protein, partial [Microcystis sp.]
MTNFSNQSLSNRSFAGENLAGANFRNADIRGCDFTNANLEGADFSGVRTGKSLRQQVILISCVITETLISIAVAIFAFGVLATFIFEKIFANVTTFNGLFAGCVAFGSGVLLCFLYLLFRLITKTHHKDLPMGQSIVAVFVGVIIILGKMGFGEFIKGNIFGGIFYFSLAIFCSWLTWFGIVLAVRTFQRATGTSFTKANLSYAQFIQSTLTGCDFSNSDISNAKFYKANLRNSVLTNINADGTDFSGAIFKGAYIQNCRINDNTKFDDVIWSRKAKTGWLDFSNQDLRNYSFKDDQNLVGANFRNADIRGCDFTNANLEGANFSGVKAGRSRTQEIILMAVVFGILIQGVFASAVAFKFVNASLIEFAGAVVGSLIFSLGITFTFLFIFSLAPIFDNVLSVLLFSPVMYVAMDGFAFASIATFNEFTKGSFLWGIFIAVIALFLALVLYFIFYGIILEFQKILGTSFSKTNLLDAQFSQSILSNCDFSNSDLTNATFHRAKLQNVNLANAKAHGTDFSRAKFKNINIQNWSIDADTNFNDAILSRELITTLLDSSNQHPINVQDGETDTVSNVNPLDFSNQDLRNRSFKDNQNLAGANFRNADIRGCDFTNANLEGADFSGVKSGRSHRQKIILIAVALVVMIQGAFAAKIAFECSSASIIHLAVAVVGLLGLSLGIAFTFLFISTTVPETSTAILFSAVMFVAIDGFNFVAITTFNEFTKGNLIVGNLLAVITLLLGLVSCFFFAVLWMGFKELQKILGTSFSKTNLLDAQFSQSILSNCDFSNSDLTNATFHRAKLQN